MISKLSSVTVLLACLASVTAANNNVTSVLSVPPSGKETTILVNVVQANVLPTLSLMTSSKSTASATFMPTIPVTGDNKNIYTTSYAEGTVFIVIGAIMGFIFVVFTVIWLLLGIRAWYCARKEYKLQALENKYQYDPFSFNAMSTLDVNSHCSDGSGDSDISEKVLKFNQSRRKSTHSLGSSSTLNLLNKYENGGKQAVPAVTNSRASMFISPTEILQQQNSSYLNFNGTSQEGSTTSTPTEKTITQFIGSTPNYFDRGRAPGVLLFENPTDALAVSMPLSDIRQEQTRKSFRPPSVHLDQMFDEDD